MLQITPTQAKIVAALLDAFVVDDDDVESLCGSCGCTSEEFLEFEGQIVKGAADAG
jgi:hypothetical protein